MSFDKDAFILRAVKAGAYRVAESGQVWRKKVFAAKDGKPAYARWVAQTMSAHHISGRIYFNMRFEGIMKSVLLNRVVALVHLPNPDGLAEVNHKFGILTHNGKNDLEWASRGEQEKHAFKHGLKANRGSSNANAKLDATKVLAIRASSATTQEIARAFDVSVRTVRDVVSRKTWSHL